MRELLVSFWNNFPLNQLPILNNAVMRDFIVLCHTQLMRYIIGAALHSVLSPTNQRLPHRYIAAHCAHAPLYIVYYTFATLYIAHCTTRSIKYCILLSIFGISLYFVTLSLSLYFVSLYFVSLSLILFISLFLYLYFYLTLSIYIYISISIYIYIYIYIYIFFFLYLYIFSSMSFCLYISLSKISNRKY